jgi:hypothetical protein
MALATWIYRRHFPQHGGGPAKISDASTPQPDAKTVHDTTLGQWFT